MSNPDPSEVLAQAAKAALDKFPSDDDDAWAWSEEQVQYMGMFQGDVKYGFHVEALSTESVLVVVEIDGHHVNSERYKLSEGGVFDIDGNKLLAKALIERVHTYIEMATKLM